MIISSEHDMILLAQKLAALLNPRDIVLLRGDLGAGKTFLARAVIRALTGRADEEVPSPTFTLLQNYDTSKGPIYHFDLYRLKNSDEVWELGFEEALHDGITLVEWPERLGGNLPPDRLDIGITFNAQNDARVVTLTGHGNWAQRISEF